MNPDSGSEVQPKERQYGEVLLDKSKLFHGVGFDTIRFKSILEHGILSENAASQRGMNHTRNYGGYNLSDAVSVVESPSIHNTFTFGAFRIYIKDGISFVIDGVNGFKARQGSSRDSGFVDEAYVSHEVPRSNISGVMVPEDALSKPVSELPIGLSHMGYGFVDNRSRRILADLEHELGYKADATALEEIIQQKEALENSDMDYLEKDKGRKELFNAMETNLQSHIGQAYSHHMGKETVTLRDVMTKYLPDGMQIYNSDGFPIDVQQGQGTS